MLRSSLLTSTGRQSHAVSRSAVLARRWKSLGSLALGFLTVGAISAPSAQAQVPCQTYRLERVPVTVERPVTSYRQVTEWVTETRDVTEFKDVRETETRRTVSYKPVFDTEEVLETRTVRKPITETRVETRTRNVWEYEDIVEQREEVITVPKEIRETHYRDVQQVQRVPTTTTVMQNEAVTTLRPVTSYHTQYVDQGGYVNQVVQSPSTVSNRLRWLPPNWTYDPVSGVNVTQRRGLYWVPTVNPGTVSVQQAYVPNVVAQHIPVTNYVPETHVQQRPVQVTQYVDQVSVTRVPYEQVRTEYEQQVVQRPVTVRRPVMRQIVEEVPITETRWVEEQVQVPVRTQRVRYEEVVEEHPVEVLRRVPVVKQVEVRHPVTRWVEETRTERVIRYETRRIPLDQFGNPIRVTPAPAATTGEAEAIEGRPTGGSTADQAPGMTSSEGAAAAQNLQLRQADGSDVQE